MKDLTIKKHYQRAHLSIVQSSLSNSLKFTLKCFEIILFNHYFVALVARFFGACSNIIVKLCLDC